MEKSMYIVRELQNSSSHRDPSYIFATSLKEAKKTAKKLQFFIRKLRWIQIGRLELWRAKMVAM